MTNVCGIQAKSPIHNSGNDGINEKTEGLIESRSESTAKP